MSWERRDGGLLSPLTRTLWHLIGSQCGKRQIKIFKMIFFLSDPSPCAPSSQCVSVEEKKVHQRQSLQILSLFAMW